MNTLNRERKLAVRNGRTPFEAKLIADGLATAEQFDDARNKAQNSGISRLSALEEVIGQTLPPVYLHLYKQLNLFELKILYGIECIDPSIEFEKFIPARLKELINSRVIPMEICRECQVLPFAMDEKFLYVAVAAPINSKTLDVLNRLASSKNLTLKRRVISQEDFLRIFDQVRDREEDLKIDDFDRTSEANPEDQEIDKEYDSKLDLNLLVSEDSAPIIKLVNQIFVRAIQAEASEILVEPLETHLRIRLRIDGKLQDMIEDESQYLPVKIVSNVINRIKIIANLDNYKRSIPQFGKFYRLWNRRRINFHVYTLPIANGEKVRIKVLDSIRLRQTIDKLIVDPISLLITQNLCSERSGLVIVTGGTDAGITTTLYALLNQANDLNKAIYTVEDPIEYSLGKTRITQMEVKQNQDMADVLRSAQDQSPEVLMVSDIKTSEIARMLIETAAKGLALSSLPSSHSVTALSQLMEMNTDSTNLSAALNGIIFQQLLRKVCNDCRIPYNPDQQEIEQYGLPKSDLKQTFYKANPLTDGELNDANICSKCAGKGYKGRIAAFEIMPITEELRIAIAQGISASQIRQIAISEGMKTLLEYSFELVREGKTTLDQVSELINSNPLLKEELQTKIGRFFPSESNISFPQVNPQLNEKSNVITLDGESLVRGIIETLDSLDAIIQALEPHIELHDAQKQIAEKLLQVLQKEGICVIDTIGRSFDPNWHEIVNQVPTILESNLGSKIITKELKRGYLLGDRILRRAEVEI